MIKTVSDKRLLTLWRLAVREIYGNYCVVCRSDGTGCHHVIKCGQHATRWDYRNGIVLCVRCHHIADNDFDYSLRLIKPEFQEYIVSMRFVGYKDLLHDRGLIDDEFRIEMRDALQTIIRGDIWNY